MFNRYLTYYSPPIQFVVFCAITTMSLFIGGHLVEFLNLKYLGLAPGVLDKLTEIPNDLAMKLKVLNPVLLVVILLLPGLLFAYLAYPKPLTYLGLNARIPVSHIVFALLLFAASIPFVYLLEEWNRAIPFLNSPEDSYSVISTAMLRGNSYSDLLINTLSICLIPALAEEIFFRGCLQQVMLNWMRSTPYFALVMVAVLFSAYHAQLSGFIPRVFLGLLLGLVYYYSANLWLSIAIHFLNNLMAVLFTFLFQRGIMKTDLNQVTHMNIGIGLMSLAVAVIIAWFFYKRRKEFQPLRIEKDTEENL